MPKQFFIGIDGGASKCLVRLEDDAGKLLAQETSGPANIRISVAQAWESIYAALDKLLQPLSLSLKNKDYQFHVGMGLAGCEIAHAYEAFIVHPHHFHTLVVSSDAHIACLGAHKGKDGAIIIAGTGVVGYQIQQGKTAKISGWGFPHDDEGSGAWLGLEAVKMTLQSLDGRRPPSNMTNAIYSFFDKNHSRFVAWANNANSTAFAELAPLVIEQSQKGDQDAQTLLKLAAASLDKVSDALLAAQSNGSKPLHCVLLGGVAPFLAPSVGKKLQARLCESALPPDAGAVLLVRDYLKEKV